MVTSVGIISGLWGVNGQINYACMPNHCEIMAATSGSKRCPSVAEMEAGGCRPPGHMVMANVTDCGCCHKCIQILREGQLCESHDVYGNLRSICGPGLTCNSTRNRCIRIDTACTRAQLAFDELMELANLTSAGNGSDSQEHRRLWDLVIRSRPRPQCNEFGDYKSVECKTGTM